jgi:hypothetical protein
VRTLITFAVLIGPFAVIGALVMLVTVIVGRGTAR